MAAAYVLLQFGADPCSMRFEDLEARPAFTIAVAGENPNPIVRVTREPAWAQQHPDIMGPSAAFLYLGPASAPGVLAYGNGPPQSMAHFRRQKRDGSSSRYFVAQNRSEYKWRVSPRRCECIDAKGAAVAVWEHGELDDVFHARLTLRPPALPVVTDVLTTLTLNLLALQLKW